MSSKYQPYTSLDDGDPEEPQKVSQNNYKQNSSNQKVCIRLDKIRHADICKQVAELSPVDVLNALELGLAIQELGEDLTPILGKFFKRKIKKANKNGIVEKMRTFFLAMKEKFKHRNE